MTIEEAKVIYGRQMLHESSARTVKRKHKEKPLWETGKNLTLSDGKKSLIITVAEEQDALTLTSFDKDTSSVKTFEDLFTSVKISVYKDEKGKEHIERMYIKADLDYAKRKKFRFEDTDFSGKIWFEDFEDNFLRAFVYKDGKIVAVQNPDEVKGKNGKVVYTCNFVYETVTTTTSYYSIACDANGDCGPPAFMYNTNSVTTQVLWQSCWNDESPYLGPAGTGLYVQDPGFWERWDQLNGLEINWLIANPDKALEAYENFKRAEVSSREQHRFGGATLKDENGTNQNAYKHAYAAALHTLSWGPNVALTIMNNHEGGANIPGLEAQMDYWNNALGINTINFCGCEGETLRDLIQSRIGQGEGRRIVVGNVSQTQLKQTNSANLDND